MKLRFRNYLITLFTVFAMWIAITSMIQRFNCIKMTETEIFIHIPQSFIFNFKNC